MNNLKRDMDGGSSEDIDDTQETKYMSPTQRHAYFAKRSVQQKRNHGVTGKAKHSTMQGSGRGFWRWWLKVRHTTVIVAKLILDLLHDNNTNDDKVAYIA
jgi:hypothetical protein